MNEDLELRDYGINENSVIYLFYDERTFDTNLNLSYGDIKYSFGYQYKMLLIHMSSNHREEIKEFVNLFIYYLIGNLIDDTDIHP